MSSAKALRTSSGRASDQNGMLKKKNPPFVIDCRSNTDSLKPRVLSTTDTLNNLIIVNP